MSNRLLSTQGVVGGVIVVLGLLLLLDTTGVFETGPLFRFTPSLFVLVGLYALYASRFRNLVGPVTLIVVAGSVQLVTLDIVEWADLVVLWPALVILFGLSLLAGRFRRRVPTTERSYLELLAVFGGVNRRAVGSEFEGASLTALFGGTTLDLRDVRPAERPVEVTVMVLFGGAEVVVPRGWNVEFDVLPVLGGTDDERLRVEPDHEGVDLVLRGTVAFGGVTVTD
jgi:predicted membrane protein